jgi:hypothetical protein
VRQTLIVRIRLGTQTMVNVMSDKRTNRIRDQLQEEIAKLREEGEVPEILDLIRQIERANEKLKKPPKKDWFH